MGNFTPLKPIEKKKRKINKFLIFGNLFLVILVALIGIFYYNQTLQTTEQKAATKKCREYDKVSECNKACSPPKDNNLAFECKWIGSSNSCKESSTACGSGGGSGDVCPNTAPPDLPDGCDWAGDCCVPGNTSTGDTDCQGYGPRLTFCASGFICHPGDGCFPPQNPSNPPGATNTPTPTLPNATNTPTSTKTPTSTPTRTPTPTPTDVITNTPTPTPTGTIVPSNTPTVTPTNTPGPSATPTPTDVPGAPTATPTEIILAQTTVTSPPSVPVTGMVQSFVYLIPALIMLVGLIL